MACAAKKTGIVAKICNHVPLLPCHCAIEAPMLFEVGRLKLAGSFQSLVHGDRDAAVEEDRSADGDFSCVRMTPKPQRRHWAFCLGLYLHLGTGAATECSVSHQSFASPAMARNLPDERLVYLALKTHFMGADAQVRKLKKVRDVIQKYQHHVDIQDLIQEHNIDDVCTTAKALLEQQIFESTLKAKIRFPEVFEVSPAQSAER